MIDKTKRPSDEDKEALAENSEDVYLICDECGHEQIDMGAGVTCEECGAIMPRP